MLQLQTQGIGNHLILLHGFCENSTCFNEQVLLLKDHFTVTTIDLPGVADSPYTEPLSIEKMADEVHRVMVQNKIESAVMIGHSMGGYVTLAFAKKYSEFLKGFGLLHSTANPDTDERKVKRDQAIAVIQQKGMEFYVEHFIPPLFAPNFHDQSLIDNLVIEGMRNTQKNIIAQLLAMKNRPSSRELLTDTDLPVLFMAGKNDAIIPLSDVVEQAASVAKGKLTILQQSAHMGMIEEKEACASGLIEFATMCFQS